MGYATNTPSFVRDNDFLFAHEVEVNTNSGALETDVNYNDFNSYLDSNPTINPNDMKMSDELKNAQTPKDLANAMLNNSTSNKSDISDVNEEAPKSMREKFGGF